MKLENKYPYSLFVTEINNNVAIFVENRPIIKLIDEDKIKRETCYIKNDDIYYSYYCENMIDNCINTVNFLSIIWMFIGMIMFMYVNNISF